MGLVARVGVFGFITARSAIPNAMIIDDGQGHW
jgi:hypothetical protein